MSRWKKKKAKKKRWVTRCAYVCVCVCVCVSSQTANRAAHKSVPSLPYVSRSREMFVVPEIWYLWREPVETLFPPFFNNYFFFLARDSIPLFFWNLPPFSVCLCDIPSIHINILSCDTHSTSIGTEMLILPGGGRGSEKVFQNYRFPLILCVCVIWPDKSVMISITKMTIKVQCVVQKHPSTILRLRDGGGMS